ncbi:MAG: hypothetical protein ABFD07_04235 [Methanobacterium sp.]
MSADNYVVVKRFGKGDFRWAMGFESTRDEYPLEFRSESFKTPKEAADNARDELMIIEYGIEFSDDCLVTE